MNEDTSTMGMNRTGIATAPRLAPQAIEGAQQGTPDARADGAAMAAERAFYRQAGDRVGSVPPPGTMKGMAKTAVAALTGTKATVIIDKLAERLAFERTGTRLYEAFMQKVASSESPEGGPTLEMLQMIHDEELAHFSMLRECLLELGADPTAQTPAADVIGVASTGLLQVITDPRTTIPQGLEALLTAELVDTASWDMLKHLMAGAGYDAMAERFQSAALTEARHLDQVRDWLTRLVMSEAGASA
jgi:rubrerythrin